MNVLPVETEVVVLGEESFCWITCVFASHYIPVYVSHVNITAAATITVLSPHFYTDSACSVSVVVGHRTSDREIASSFPAGALPGSLGQLSLPSLRGR